MDVNESFPKATFFFFMINNNDTIDLRHRGSRPLSQPFFLPLSFLPSLLATPDCFRRGLDFRDHAAFKLPFTKVSIKGSCFPAHHSLLKDSLPFQLFPAEAGTTPPPSPAIYPAWKFTGLSVRSALLYLLEKGGDINEPKVDLGLT